MKKIFLLLTLLSSIIMVQAQNDPNAKKILDNISSKLKTYKGVTADFSYSTKDRNNKMRGSVKGTISVKGQQYFIKEGTTEIYSNGSKIWNYDGESEVTVTDVDQDDKTLNPQNFLTDFYDKDFTYKLVSSSGNFYNILMIPTDKRKNFRQVSVFVDKNKMLITKAVIVDKSSNTVEFSLSDVVTNVNIPDSKFVFNTAKHPGVEVISE